MFATKRSDSEYLREPSRNTLKSLLEIPFEKDDTIPPAHHNATYSHVQETVKSLSLIPPCTIEQLYNDEAQTYIENSLRHLKHATSQDELGLYILFGFESTDELARIRKLRQHLDKFPTDKIINRRLLLECSVNAHTELCTPTDIERILSVLPDNAAYWLDVANYFAGINDDVQFQASLKKALESNSYDETFVSEIVALVRFLDATQTHSFANVAAAAIGFEAAVVWAVDNTLDKCFADDINVELSDLCLQLGKDMENRSKHTLSKQTGIAIQTNIAKRKNNFELATQLEQHNLAISDEMKMKRESITPHALYDRDLFETWQLNTQMQGDVAAINTVEKVLLNKLQNPSYIPCPTM